MNTGCSLSSWTSCGLFTRTSRMITGSALLRRAIPSMAFAQLTYRESLRDIIETSHGLPPAAPALENERRDWRICGVGPAAQHPGEDAVTRELALDLTNTATPWTRTIALCLSVFPWAHFRNTKAATRCSTCGATFRVLSTSRMASCDVHALDMLLPEAGATRMWLRRLCPPLCVAPSSSRVPSRTSMLIASIRRRRIARPASFATRPSPWTASTPVRITPNFCGASASRTPSPARRWSSSPTTSRFRPPPSARSTKAAGRWNSSSWIKQHLRIKQFYGTSENAVADLDCRLGLRPRRHRQEAPRPGRLALHFVTDPLGDPLRENAHTSSTCGRRKQMQRFENNQPIEFIRFLTGH